MTLSKLGIGALLAAPATLSAVLMFAGAACLFGLGSGRFRAGGQLPAAPIATRAAAGRMVAHAWPVKARTG